MKKARNLPDIPPWPDQIKNTGKHLLRAWFEQEREEAIAQKRKSDLKQYVEFCQNKIARYEYQQRQEWIRSTQLTESESLFLHLFQVKIEFYIREKPKVSDRLAKYWVIIRDIFATTPDIDREELKKQTIEKARQFIDPHKEDSYGKRYDPKQVGRIVAEFFPPDPPTETTGHL